MSFLLGLTGSIGMGKSTTAQFFRDAGVPVWDADAVVHKLYDVGGDAVTSIAALCPEAIINGAVDRDTLKLWISKDAQALSQIEAAVHPLVAAHRAAFLVDHADAPLVLLDMPLLFETGADAWLDAVLVVTAPRQEQRRRVLERPGMTDTMLEGILARQLPDTEKRVRADHVITTRSLEQTRADVGHLIKTLLEQPDA